MFPCLILGSTGCGPSASETPVDAAILADASPSTDAAPPLDAAREDARIVFLHDGEEVSEIVYGQPVDMRVEGLTADVVEIEAALWGYRSRATFRPDAHGTVLASRDAPLEGSYSGADADGLVWSMTQESNETDASLAITYVVRHEGVELARATLERRRMAADATIVPLSEDGLVGTLYVPPGDGPHPTILVLGGSEGGQPDFTAAYLETMGYATLALAYFGVPGLPPELSEIPLEYFDRALDWLRARPEVDADRLGVVGGSRGGELALILASRHADLAAVVAQVPSGLVHGSVDGTSAAWTADGEPLVALPTPPDAMLTPELLGDGRTAYRASPAIDDALDDASPADVAAATIPVDRSDAPILLIGAEDDGVWPSCRLMGYAWARLQASGHAASYGDEQVCLPDAGHGVGVPGWPTEGSYAAQAFGFWLVLGGTPEGNGRGAREIDTRLRSFLAAHL